MSERSEWDKMVAGELYQAGGSELIALREHAHEVCRQAGRLSAGEGSALLAEIFGHVGNGFYVENGFFCDYGKLISVGDMFYANAGLVVLDSCPVTIGDRVMIGPQVGIYTATHPLDHRLRAQGQEYAKPITIGSDVWIGGHCVINPGVTIGSRVVVASGSVVTKDVPDGVVVGGNPARILKRLEEEA